MSDKNKTYVHPNYNHGYARYDLDIDDIVKGLKEQGYNLGDDINDDDIGDIGGSLDESYRLEVLSTNGTRCNTTSFNTILYPRLYKNNVDITNDIPASCFKWIRISGSSEVAKKEDAEWNLRFASGSKECPITREDIKRGCLFRCLFTISSSEDLAYVRQAYQAYIKN